MIKLINKSIRLIMRGNTYTKKEKLEVKKLILAGISYNKITTMTGVPKSTISTWFGKTLHKPWDRPTMLNHLANIRKLAAPALKEKWAEFKKKEKNQLKAKIRDELPSYPISNLGFQKSLLAMLYWAEGDKYNDACRTKFANTDPDLAKLYVNLLRNCYDIDESKFRIILHLHYYHPISKVKNYWSKILKIPQVQFNKVYIKKRGITKKYRKNFAGICFIYYGESKIAKELVELGKTLQKIITRNAPVAQWIERRPAEPKIIGSTPIGRTLHCVQSKL